MLLNMLISFLLTVATLSTAADDKIFLPHPSGKYHVGKTQHVFNHTTFHDPVALEGSNNTGKFIVATLIYPTNQPPTAETSLKYMDYELANQLEIGWGIPTGKLQSLWTFTQWQAPLLPEIPGETKLPTLLYAPGAGMPCSSGSMITAEMASRGYTIVCVDHPGEAPYLEIPYSGGEGQYGIPINYDWADITFFTKINRIRKDDYDAVLELYAGLNTEHGSPFNASHFIHFGFSMGGSIGADVVASHDSVLGGINFDGMFIDNFLGEAIDVKKPFLMLRDDQNRTDDLTWGWFQGNQSGWWEHVLVKGSHHLDFSDVPFWFDLLGLEGLEGTSGVGTIGSSRIHEVMTCFSLALFDKVLGKEEHLLEISLPSEEWPDLVVVNRSSSWSIDNENI